MVLDHYCLGTAANNYAHKIDEEYEDDQPMPLVFESRDMAYKVCDQYTPYLKVFKVNPYDIVNHELEPHDHCLYLCVDVRDGQAWCLELTYWEFFDRLSYVHSLVSDSEIEVLPLHHCSL